MPRALEALDHVVRRLGQGELSALEAIDILLSEELTLRENSRIKTALRMGRLATINADWLRFHVSTIARQRSDLHACRKRDPYPGHEPPQCPVRGSR